MHEHRFLCDGDLRAGVLIALPPGEAHHVVRVLRLRPGEEISLFDGEGTEAVGRIAAIRGGAVDVNILEARSRPRPAPAIALWAPWLKEAPRVDWLVEKAGELGVARLTVYGTPRGTGAKREERWRRVAVAAAKQSGQAWLMAIRATEEPLLACDPGKGSAILLSEKAGVAPLRDALPPEAPDTILLAVGPEKGISPEVESAAASRGWRLASLGPMRLRAETAAIAAVAGVRAVTATASSHLGE
jgi:16S rRNA (uracil1498-N3)-methyltransferase